MDPPGAFGRAVHGILVLGPPRGVARRGRQTRRTSRARHAEDPRAGRDRTRAPPAGPGQVADTARRTRLLLTRSRGHRAVEARAGRDPRRRAQRSPRDVRAPGGSEGLPRSGLGASARGGGHPSGALPTANPGAARGGAGPGGAPPAPADAQGDAAEVHRTGGDPHRGDRLYPPRPRAASRDRGAGTPRRTSRSRRCVAPGRTRGTELGGRRIPLYGADLPEGAPLRGATGPFGSTSAKTSARNRSTTVEACRHAAKGSPAFSHVASRNSEASQP